MTARIGASHCYPEAAKGELKKRQEKWPDLEIVVEPPGPTVKGKAKAEPEAKGKAKGKKK